MIELMVEDYCHECDAFEPIKDEQTAYEYNTMGGICGSYRVVAVKCQSARRCANMIRYLERRRRNNEEN